MDLHVIRSYVVKCQEGSVFKLSISMDNIDLHLIRLVRDEQELSFKMLPEFLNPDRLAEMKRIQWS